MRKLNVIFFALLILGSCSTQEQEAADDDKLDAGPDSSIHVDIGLDTDEGSKTDAADMVVATNPVGPNELWPSELPDCVEQIAYQENAVFKIPQEAQTLSRNLAELRDYADSLIEGYTSTEVTVLSPGNALIALSNPGEEVRVGVALARAHQVSTPLYVAGYVDHQPVETKLIREITGESEFARIHQIDSEKAEILELQFPSSPTPSVRELELFIWGQHPTNPSRDRTSFRKITHYNGVITPHTRPCMIPVQLGEKTDFEGRLGYFPNTTMRLNLDLADFRYIDRTMPRDLPVFTAKVGESIDFLMTIGAPNHPFKVGGQVVLFSTDGSVHKTFGVVPPPSKTTTNYTSILRYRLPITFTKPGRVEFVLAFNFDPYSPQSRVDGSEFYGFPSSENSNSVIIDVVE